MMRAAAPLPELPNQLSRDTSRVVLTWPWAGMPAIGTPSRASSRSVWMPVDACWSRHSIRWAPRRG